MKDKDDEWIDKELGNMKDWSWLKIITRAVLIVLSQILILGIVFGLMYLVKQRG